MPCMIRVLAGTALRCRKESDMEEKLMYENEIFYMDCMRQSKAGIYARSKEIDMKNQIARLLMELGKEDESLQGKLLSLDNILEEAYRFVDMHQFKDRTVEEGVRAWLSTL